MKNVSPAVRTKETTFHSEKRSCFGERSTIQDKFFIAVSVSHFCGIQSERKVATFLEYIFPS